MDKKLSNLISELIKETNIQGVKSVDWVKELKEMYDKVEKLETELELIKSIVESETKSKIEAQKKLTAYSIEYVIPAQELQKAKDLFEKEKFEFDIEKKWITKDRNNLLEIVRMLTSKIMYSLNESSGNNGSHKNISQNNSIPP